MTNSTCAFAGALVLASVAAAQQPMAPPPSAPASDSTSVAPAAAPEDEPFRPGFRAGGSAGIGAFLPAPAMLSFHLFDLHGGVQVSPMFGAYVRFGLSTGIGFGATAGMGGGSLSVSAAGVWLVGANAELGLGDSFFLAGGPQVGLGSWTRVGVMASTAGGGVSTLVASGPMPGLNVKVGAGFGQPNRLTKRRGQFTIALDVSMLYATKVVDVNAMGSATGAGIQVTFAEALAIVPTLHLGYEFR